MSGEPFRRGAVYVIPHRMPDEVPLVALKARVIEDIRLAEDDVPLIRGEWLTDAGIHYLDSILDDPEDTRVTPNQFYRKSWREGLTSTPAESKVEDMASINGTKSRVQEARERRAALEAELRAADERVLEAERAERELNRKLIEPGPGSKIMIEATFPGSSRSFNPDPPKTYQYLAMRTDNPREGGANWYVTGQKGKLTWADVINLVKHAREVELFDLNFHR